ncbi:lanthionine synthetase C family protein [Cytobacillus sp. FSL K6-0265]|uniref:lanthionine synthetase C family protein n=1 Tax=Cytobacillus sp. FSL K6-0265 TaxID=2921448 RepID=UPI0030F7D12E
MQRTTDINIFINSKLQQNIQEIVFIIAERLKDPYEIAKLGKRKDGNHTFFPITFSHGYPGTIVFFTELDRQYPNNKWDIVAHEHFLALEKNLRDTPISNISLFTGLTGIAFATFLASRRRTRYNRFLNHLEELLHKNIEIFIDQATESWLKNKSAKASMFDVIGGLTGVGRYLLMSNQNNRHINHIIKISEFLIKLTNNITVENNIIPGWYVSCKNLGSTDLEKRYPKGNLNYGLAHGIAGPLSFLSICKNEGININGQKEAIEFILNWLQSIKKQDFFGNYWSGRISLEEYTNNTLSVEKDYSRESWCYGNPGILRAMNLAGIATNNKNIIEQTINDFEIIYKRPYKNWGLESPIICHGKSGLLQITLNMLEDNPKCKLASHLPKLTEMLINQFNKESIFGYQDIEPTAEQQEYVDKAGILEGVAGIALTLLSLIKTKDTIWESSFLLK